MLYFPGLACLLLFQPSQFLVNHKITTKMFPYVSCYLFRFFLNFRSCIMSLAIWTLCMLFSLIGAVSFSQKRMFLSKLYLWHPYYSFQINFTSCPPLLFVPSMYFNYLAYYFIQYKTVILGDSYLLLLLLISAQKRFYIIYFCCSSYFVYNILRCTPHRSQKWLFVCTRYCTVF